MRIYGHRGMRKQAPENTLAAYKLAIDQGFDIELDVRMTRDEHLVCLHDSELGRTVPIEGMVWGYTLAEMKALDAGGWFSPQYQGERIPTLEEALDLAKGKAHIALEMKCPGIERPLIRLLEHKAMLKEVFIFDVGIEDIHFASRLKSVGSEVRVGRNCVALHDFQVLQESNFKDIDVIMAVTQFSWLTKDLVNIAHGHGVEVIDTGVHDAEKMKRCLSLGVDGICSDCPDEMQKVLTE